MQMDLFLDIASQNLKSEIFFNDDGIPLLFSSPSSGWAGGIQSPYFPSISLEKSSVLGCFYGLLSKTLLDNMVFLKEKAV